MSKCRNCSPNACGQPLMIADQDGRIYPVANGRIQVPDYGPHPTVSVKAAPGSPFKITADADDPNCFTIAWEATLNDNNELVAADGETILLTIPAPEPQISGTNGITQYSNEQGTTFLALKLDAQNPPPFSINQQGCITA